MAAREGHVAESVPLGVTTWTFPVVAPAGTVVVISEPETTVKTAAMPSKLTLVAPVRSLPKILTAAPTLPEVGTNSQMGPALRQAKDRSEPWALHRMLSRRNPVSA